MKLPSLLVYWKNCRGIVNCSLFFVRLMRYTSRYRRVSGFSCFDVKLRLFLPQKLKVVAQDVSTYGTFYSGDSYICLSVSVCCKINKTIDSQLFQKMSCSFFSQLVSVKPLI